MRRLILIILLLASVHLVSQTSNTISFNFTVPNGVVDASTSAGVYDSTGAMVRYLWGGVIYPPGTYQQTWDGNLQNGTAATTGATYTIKVLENNVTYTYDGRLFDTQTGLYTGNHYGNFGWQQTGNMVTYTFVGNQGWFTGGYSEQKINMGQFTDPNYPRPVSLNYQNNYVQFMDIATDNTWVYLMNVAITPSSGQSHSSITALDATSGMPVFFTNGTLTIGPTCPGYPSNGACSPIQDFQWGNTTVSLIDVTIHNGAGASADPTGIAVQRSSNILAVAQGANLINLFDKRSGSSLGTVTSIAAPTWMAFNSEGLWVVSAGGLYLVTGLPSSPVVTQPITGFSNVVAVATNGSTGSIFVLDGGTHQQMFEYAVTTHTLMRTYGTAGGYGDCNPTITNDRMMFDRTYSEGNSTVYRSWIRVQDSDDVWILDGGTANRILHISPSNTYVGRVLTTNPTYQMFVSESVPTRIFLSGSGANEVFEYDVNYSVPIVAGDPDPVLGGNGSWTLAKNWTVCQNTGLRLPVVGEQLSNGQFYAEMNDGTNYHLYLLPTSGPMKITTTDIVTNRPQLLRNGNMIYSATTGTTPAFTTTYFVAPLTGFGSDPALSPQYGSFVSVDSATTTSANSWLIPPRPGAPWPGSEPTTGGVYPVYVLAPQNTSSTSNKPHLGGIKGGIYSMQTLPEVCTFYSSFNGTFPCTNSFGGANGIGPPRAEGHTFFAMYNGQGATYGNQYWHFWEDGLLVGNFGQTNAYPCYYKIGTPGGGGAPATCGFNYGDVASNITSFGTATVGSDMYLYHPDESGTAPVHRWHIGNLSSVHEWSGTGLLQPGGAAMLTQLF